MIGWLLPGHLAAGVPPIREWEIHFASKEEFAVCHDPWRPELQSDDNIMISKGSYRGYMRWEGKC